MTAPRGPRDDGHGVTVRERAILDRAEAGMSARAIGKELGLKPSYVAQIVRMYSVNDAAHRAWREAARRSDAAFLAAVASTGRSFA